MSKLGRFAVLLSLLAALMAVPPGPVAAQQTVSVSLIDPGSCEGCGWDVLIDPASVGAGTVAFDVTNDGAIEHNFKVVLTSLPPDGLPVDPFWRTVDESRVNIVARTGDLQPGESESLTVGLPAGNYVLICNIPQHYEAGSYVGFQVTPLPVGGIAELPDIAGTPLDIAASSGGSTAAMAAAIAAAVAGAVALGAAAWYARRRWLR